MTIKTGMKARVRFMSGIAWIGLLMGFGTWLGEFFSTIILAGFKET
jgi:hypothetical protein